MSEKSFSREIHATPSTSSGLRSASAVIRATPGLVTAVFLYDNGSADATLTLYDNASEASGAELAKIKIEGGDFSGGFPLFHPVNATNGIYAELSGAGASYLVHHASVVKW